MFINTHVGQRQRKKTAQGGLFRLQEGFVEAVGEQVGERKGQLVSALVQADDFQLRGEFAEHLAAFATGDAGAVAPSGHHDALEAVVALADGLEHGSALGADGGGVSGIFNVAAGVDRAVLTLQRRAHGEVGIGAVGPLQHGNGGGLQFVTGHGGPPFSSASRPPAPVGRRGR